MITIIHGNDAASSRKYFLGEKERLSDATVVDGKSINLTDLTQIFEGGELFANPKNFFIEQVFARKKSRELDEIVNYIEANKNNNIFMWDDKELTKSNLSHFKNPIVKIFKLPQTLFLFLENIKPKNGKVLIKLFHETLASSDPEMIFFMMIRQVRTLLSVIEAGSNSIDEVKRLAPWQKSRITQQADSFEIKDLKKLYSRLFEIEKGLKTGGLTSPLTQTIDFLLLDI